MFGAALGIGAGWWNTDSGAEPPAMTYLEFPRASSRSRVPRGFEPLCSFTQRLHIPLIFFTARLYVKVWRERKPSRFRVANANLNPFAGDELRPWGLD